MRPSFNMDAAPARLLDCISPFERSHATWKCACREGVAVLHRGALQPAQIPVRQPANQFSRVSDEAVNTSRARRTFHGKAVLEVKGSHKPVSDHVPFLLNIIDQAG